MSNPKNNELFKVLCQSCINEYRGEHGTVAQVLTDTRNFSTDHVEGHTGRFNGILVVVFRGSDGTQDWIDNMKFGKTRTDLFENKKVHKGFLEQFKTLLPDARNFQEIRDAEKIVFTGHSLGAALANLFAVYFKKKYPEKEISLVTFGSPRPGDRGFSKLSNSTERSF